MAPLPITAQWDEPVVAHVLGRVAAYPFPKAPEAGGWTYGCDELFLKSLCAHWTETYDWRAALGELNRFPQWLAEVENQVIHFVHIQGEQEGRRPLLMTHGWPGSHYEFFGVAEALAFPSRFGGRSEDAFDLVIPSLPGFGFSSSPRRPLGQRRTAALFNRLMTEHLGYSRYRAQGGDWGGLVTGWLGLDHPAHVRAIHLNMLGLRPSSPPQTEAETSWAQRGAAQMQALGGYFQLQASKPQSLAWAMADNPVGQAAWIVERFHDWSDLRTRAFEAVHPMDRLLTNIMLYVMTGAFTTSVWYYRALFEEGGALLPPGVRVETPTAFANFPGEALYQAPPRSYAERAYNIVRWTDMPRGGHFAAMEEPELFIEDVRAFGRETDPQASQGASA
jgi:microsomal epoxide hydrolase